MNPLARAASSLSNSKLELDIKLVPAGISPSSTSRIPSLSSSISSLSTTPSPSVSGETALIAEVKLTLSRTTPKGSLTPSLEPSAGVVFSVKTSWVNSIRAMDVVLAVSVRIPDVFSPKEPRSLASAGPSGTIAFGAPLADDTISKTKPPCVD